MYKNVFFGPFLGEVGWCLSRWQGFCRYRVEQEFKDKHIIVASYPGRRPFYQDFAHDFIDLPRWLLDKHYEVDCYEAVDISSKDYGDLLRYFESFYDKSETLTIRTPRGCNYILPQLRQQKIIKLLGSGKACEKRDALLNGTKDYIFVSARGRTRAAQRNWPEQNWEQLVSRLLTEYRDYKIIIAGAPSGSFLKNFQDERVINIIDTPAEESIDLSLAFLNNALFSITSQSGSTHLSLQSCCPSLILGHEQKRHLIDENYLSTPGMFITSYQYDIAASEVFESSKGFLEEIQKRKREK